MMSSNDVSILVRTMFLTFGVFDQLRYCTGADWGYDDHHGNSGPSFWKRDNKDCGGVRQSPIDIVLSKARLDPKIPVIKFSGYDVIPSNVNYSLINNGHTVQLSIAGGQMEISGGDLPGDYQLVQFHVHWGGSDYVGSEHKINGRFYPMEIHFVHFAKRLNNITASLKDPQGLAVVGVFAKIGDKNAALDELISHFCAVKYKGSNTSDIRPFKLMDLLPSRTSDFIRYNGSLTTPGCQESVVWTVLRNPITISKTQLNAFRALSHSSPTESDVPLVNNYRPVQSIGTRTILRTFEIENPPPGTTRSFGTEILPPQWKILVLVCTMLSFCASLAHTHH